MEPSLPPRPRLRVVFTLLTTWAIGLAAWSCASEEASEPPPLTPDRTDATPPRGDDASDGDTDSAGADSGVAPCPGTGGPDPIRVTTPATSFCIDRSEVTRSQYEAFLATNPSPAAQAAECQWNTTFVPNLNWPDGGAAATVDAPITNVDWCDAVAYCKFVGKQLCKSVTDPDAGGVDQWQIACSRNGARKYPYGATQDLGACNGPTDGGTIKPVMSSPRCEGGYDGIFDMTGNVQEWRDGCKKAVDAGPASDTCLLGGGGFGQSADSQSCTTVFVANRNGAFNDLGFRCCSP